MSRDIWCRHNWAQWGRGGDTVYASLIKECRPSMYSSANIFFFFNNSSNNKNKNNSFFNFHFKWNSPFFNFHSTKATNELKPVSINSMFWLFRPAWLSSCFRYSVSVWPTPPSIVAQLSGAGNGICMQCRSKLSKPSPLKEPDQKQLCYQCGDGSVCHSSLTDWVLFMNASLWAFWMVSMNQGISLSG